jgi:methyltransferase
MLVRSATCLGLASARLVELAYSRRNVSQQTEAEEGSFSRKTFPLIVCLHSIVIGGTLIFGNHPRVVWLGVLALAQPVRLWVLVTLGRRWNARGAVPSDLVVASTGPYAYVRHPNYTVVIIELLALPLAFGLGRLAVAGFIANAILLSIRVRDEEQLLFKRPGYAAHFRSKRRFVPGVI